MDRSGTTDEHSKTLRRIVAVLLALADLAERASGRSFAARSLVLWLLRPGEVLARDYLAGLTRHVAGQSEPVPFADDSASEAIRLAVSFRKLAADLTALAAGVLAPSQQAIAAQGGNPVATDPFVAFRHPTTVVGRLDSS